MKFKSKIILFLAIIIVAHLYRTGYLDTEMLDWKAKDVISGNTAAKPVIEQTGDIQVRFCPQENCSDYLLKEMEKAEESLHCAFFDIDLPEIINVLEEKSKKIDVRLVVDDNNFDEVSQLDFVKQDTTSQYSHNKFCVIDGKTVTTGSFNPTFNGNYRNNNNLVIVESSKLAGNYEEEFSELWAEEFGTGKVTKDPIVILNNTTVKSYFCPEDWCANRIIDELHNANESVYFMTFSFTSEPIARKLIELHERNVTVKGVFEKQQRSKYSKYEDLLNAGIDVKWDEEKYKVHHKVFIIDEKVVITGSMNPTKSGDTRNDENILVIYDEDIAKRYVKVFESLQ
ncbi:MAG: phospholipase D-like domain-containing protein [Candidatus Nanoarchaeia archaeon]